MTSGESELTHFSTQLIREDEYDLAEYLQSGFVLHKEFEVTMKYTIHGLKKA